MFLKISDSLVLQFLQSGPKPTLVDVSVTASRPEATSRLPKGAAGSKSQPITTAALVKPEFKDAPERLCASRNQTAGPCDR